MQTTDVCHRHSFIVAIVFIVVIDVFLAPFLVASALIDTHTAGDSAHLC